MAGIAKHGGGHKSFLRIHLAVFGPRTLGGQDLLLLGWHFSGRAAPMAGSIPDRPLDSLIRLCYSSL